jgi:hypothetical protein
VTDAQIEKFIEAVVPFVPAVVSYYTWLWACGAGTFEVKVGPRYAVVPRGHLVGGWILAAVLGAVGVALDLAGGAKVAAALGGVMALVAGACLLRLRGARRCPGCQEAVSRLRKLRAETGRGGKVTRYRLSIDCPSCDFKATGRVKAGPSSLGELEGFVTWAGRLVVLGIAVAFGRVLLVALGVATLVALVGGLVALGVLLTPSGRVRHRVVVESDWDLPDLDLGGPDRRGDTGGSSSLGGGSSGGGGAGRSF